MSGTVTLKKRLQRKEFLHGIWRLIRSEQLTEIIGASGFDFQIFDREHGAYDFGSLETAIRTCELVGSSPLIRVTAINSTEVQKCLDAGAHGVVFPQLGGFEDFRKAVQCMKYPPLGCRGFNPFTRAGNYAALERPSERTTDDFAVCVPIIETLSAVSDLDKILDLPGIDLLYVGAYDLSVQLGCKGSMNHPKLVDTMFAIIDQCKQRAVPTSVMVKDQEQIAYFRKIGVSAFVHMVDTSIVQSAFKDQARCFVREV